MKQDFYSRKQVIALIDNLMQHADAVSDAINSEDPQNDAEQLLEMSEGSIDAKEMATPDRSEYDQITSNKHNSICLQRAADDEPIFVLRAKDSTAPATISVWCTKNIGIQPDEKIKGAMALMQKMKIWRENNIINPAMEKLKEEI